MDVVASTHWHRTVEVTSGCSIVSELPLGPARRLGYSRGQLDPILAPVRKVQLNRDLE